MGERLRAVTIGWLTLVGSVVLILAAMALTGWLLPDQRIIARSLVLAQSPETVWALVADPQAEALWNPGVMTLTRHEAGGWLVREGDDVVHIHDEIASPGREVVRSRHLDDGAPPVERWTIRLDPAGSGARVTLTSRREIHSPFARCWARLGGDERRIERALAGLARHFGQSAAIDTVPTDTAPSDAEEAHAEPPQAVPVR